MSFLKDNRTPNSFYYHFSAPWQQVVLEKYLNSIHACPDWRYLDVGCGAGNNLGTTLKFGNNITALEPAPKALEYCQKRYDRKSVNFVQGAAEKLPFNDASFDVVIFTEVLEHVASPEKSLQEAERVLKQGGHCILSFQTYINLAGITKLFMKYVLKRPDWDTWGDSAGQTEHMLTVPKVKMMLRSTRFKPLRGRGADYLNAWLVWLPFIHQNYKLLDRFPFFFLGKLPIIKWLGMDYFILLQKR